MPRLWGKPRTPANPFGPSLALTIGMWKRLLVPLDSSECAARALEVAVGFGERHDAALALVHVSPLPPNLPADALVTPPGAGEPERIDEYTRRAGRERLERTAAPLRARGLDVQTLALVTESGDVAGEILRAAADVQADAIVVGTHGRSGLSHLFLGSIAEKVIRRAEVPVVTVRSPACAAEPTREERVAEDETAG